MNILQYESLIVSIITLITTLLGFWLKNKIQAGQGRDKLSPAQKAQKEMEILTRTNQEIYDFLSGFRKKFQADRSYVFEFSNGSYFSSGLPITKFTCTYETVSEGITSECHNPGEYRVSNFNEYIKTLIDGEIYALEDIDLCTKTLLKELLLKKGVKSVYNFPIKDIHGRVVGFLGLDFVKIKKKLTSQQINTAEQSAQALGGYLKIDDVI